MTEAEWPTDYNPQEGHLPDMQPVFLDLYRLLTIFLSAKEFNKRRNPNTWKGEDTMSALQELEISEITRILISSAVVGRIVDDREVVMTTKFNSDCGVLCADLTMPGVTQPLTLRDAFNKIIHAKKIRFDLEKGAEGWSMYLKPVMYFYGSKQDKNWKATLRVEDYVDNYYQILKYA